MIAHFRTVCVLALACLAPVAAQDSTQVKGALRWQLEPGDKIPCTFTLLLEESFELKGMMPPQQTQQEVSYGATHEVKSIEGDVATIEATVDSIRARMGLGMMGEMAYDSKSDDEQNPMRGIRHAVGQKFTFKLSRSGQVSGVTGGDALVQAMRDAMGKEKPPAGQGGGDQGGMGGMMGFDPNAVAAQVAAQLPTIVFSDAALSGSLQLVNGVLPTDETAAAWSRDVDVSIPGAGRLKFKADHETTGAADGNVRIGAKVPGEIEFERDFGGAGGGDPMADQVRKMMGDAKVIRKEAHGSASFSTTKGRLLDSELVVQVDSEGDLPPFLKAMMGQQGGGEQLPDDIKMARNTAVTMRYVLEAPSAGGAATPAPAPAPQGGDKTGQKF